VGVQRKGRKENFGIFFGENGGVKVGRDKKIGEGGVFFLRGQGGSMGKNTGTSGCPGQTGGRDSSTKCSRGN